MPRATVTEPRGEVTTLPRALNLLRILGASERPIGVNEIARRREQHASAVSRTLSTLEHNGLVQRDEDPRITIPARGIWNGRYQGLTRDRSIHARCFRF
ncbi:MAG: MarR family transcriptional regulator [Mesorhizobium sp.]|uniref:helix-turn-helix domain-containing protein n=1 Tax=Mesorhizobium sp. TaxID=1871066 RepID=UPI000FCB1515|nr:MarR family transcriptional regulator [Mesorhizobium sp. M1A.F.Ca.IN.020.04.1.1]RUW08197.1 MarR family transcriptional regulator [Mesorhizobium sp. M1A.F.Ca.IN.020.03.1.1]RVD19252.1 MarR family transcriptional regulator [Mesorhizobium sp. M4B.F.Ca.ET.017.02.2.1]RWA58587.1 MAG: MarR family transcriptional regulator [Mesorhizobium sp.]TGQ03980.1 MarR family transcriptional regulator [Mesorhizobium sp. M4B.F.Ca.ET.215.01.1.1]TGQ24087.1 MarR family transcriptional regulator [Mesorhizobium sp. M